MCHRYEGSWYADKKHGQGKNIFMPSGHVYEGSWEAGECSYCFARRLTIECHAIFAAVTLVGKRSVENSASLWRADEMHGFGEYTFEDGTVEKGEWVRGKRV